MKRTRWIERNKKKKIIRSYSMKQYEGQEMIYSDDKEHIEFEKNIKIRNRSNL